MSSDSEERWPADGFQVSAAEVLRILRRVIQTVPLGVVVTDTEGRIIFANPAEARMLGYEVGELLGQNVSILASAELQHRMTVEEMRTIKTWSRESLNRRKDGSSFPVQLLSDVVTDASGQPIAIVTTAEDVTERKRSDAEVRRAREELETKVRERTSELLKTNEALEAEVAERREAERALRDSEARYRLLFERSLAAVARTSLEGRILDCNESFSRMLGHASRDEVIGTNIAELSVNPSSYESFARRLGEQGSLGAIELRLKRKDGAAVWVLENASLLVENEAEPPTVLRTSVDITQRKKVEEQILHDALHDSLTGLANRALFSDRLRHAVTRSRRHKRAIAVLFVDLDRFKIVNDSLGHVAGDKLLVALSERLKTCVRDADTIARLGGDEFTLVLEDIDGLGDATRTAMRIQEVLTRPFRLDGQEVYTTASIGIALGGGGGPSPDDLLRDADIAMYRAKALGKARYEVFDAAMRQRAVTLLQMETDLRRAVERDEFSIHYQPIVSLEDGSLTGFEALLRWKHPQRGRVLPMDFIPLAEETGLISPIGSWVLDRACRTLRQWHDRFPKSPPLSMSVNLSSKQFSKPELLSQIGEALRRSGVDPRSLTLEITESLLLDNTETAVSLLDQIRTFGVSLSLDDFGTGYSSLSYLHRLPLQKLKIDRSFIMQIEVDRTKAEIVRAIVDLAQTLQLEVIAEGVESTGPLEPLKRIRCASAQGFYFSPPIEEERVDEMLGHAYSLRDSVYPDRWVMQLPLS